MPEPPQADLIDLSELIEFLEERLEMLVYQFVLLLLWYLQLLLCLLTNLGDFYKVQGVFGPKGRPRLKVRFREPLLMIGYDQQQSKQLHKN